MAKAKDLYKEYIASGYDLDVLTDVMVTIYSGIPKLIKERRLGPHNPRAVLSVFNQVEQQYKAFASRVNSDDSKHQVNEDGFFELMEKCTPEVYDAYVRLKAAV